MRFTVAALLVVLSLPASTRAQAAGLPQPGERVYVRHAGDRIEGILLGLGDTVAIETLHGVEVIDPLPALIYRHAGYTSPGRGFLVGAGIGALAGAVLTGSIVYLADPEGDEYLTTELITAAWSVAGGVAGLLVGGVVGLSFSGDDWEAVRLTPSVGLGGPGHDRFLVGLELRF